MMIERVDDFEWIEGTEDDFKIEGVSENASEAQCGSVVLLHCGCLSLNPFIEFSIRNNSSSSDVLNIQASISISPKFKSE